jgi:hypothetical protein
MLILFGIVMVQFYDVSLDRKVYNHEGRVHDVHEVVEMMMNVQVFRDVGVVMVKQHDVHEREFLEFLLLLVLPVVLQLLALQFFLLRLLVHRQLVLQFFLLQQLALLQVFLQQELHLVLVLL